MLHNPLGWFGAAQPLTGPNQRCPKGRGKERILITALYAEGQSVGASGSRAGQNPRAPGAKHIDSRLGRRAPWLPLRIPWKEKGEEARAPLQSISWRRGPVPTPAPCPHQPLRRRAGESAGVVPEQKLEGISYSQPQPGEAVANPSYVLITNSCGLTYTDLIQALARSENTFHLCFDPCLACCFITRCRLREPPTTRQIHNSAALPRAGSAGGMRGPEPRAQRPRQMRSCSSSHFKDAVVGEREADKSKRPANECGALPASFKAF
nr:uncharacterized protein LOC110361308 [Columba livia]